MMTLDLSTTFRFSLRKALVALFFAAVLIIAIGSCKPEPDPIDDRRVSIGTENNL